MGYSKIFVVREKDGFIKVQIRPPKRDQELVLKINKPWNEYYVGRVKRYFGKKSLRS